MVAKEVLRQALSEVDSSLPIIAASLVLPDGKRSHDFVEAETGAHVHDSWELIFVLEGRMPLRLPRQKQRFVNAPAAVLMPPHCVHVAIDQGNPHRSRSLRYFCLTTEKGQTYVAYMDYRRHLQERYYFTLEDLQDWHERMLGPSANVLEQISGLARQEKGSSEGVYIETLLRLLLISLQWVLTREKLSSLTSSEWAAFHALEEMRRRYPDPDLDIGQLAREVHLAPTYFASLFKRITGNTVRQTLIQIRMDRAEALLRAGRFSIKETSALTGWRNQLYFSTAFKRHFGFPPSQLRRETAGGS